MIPSDKNYESTLPGTWNYSNSWNNTGGTVLVPTARYGKEERAGFQHRPKPKGWKEPLPYIFGRDAYDRGSGSLRRHWVNRFDPKLTYDDQYIGFVGAGAGSPVDTLNIMGNYPFQGDVDLDYLEDLCYRKCYNKARQMTVNIGVAVGEANKTIGMVRDTARRISWSVFALKKGRYREAASVLGVRPGPRRKDWARKWLEWKYGWMPLMNDIYGSCEALAKYTQEDWLVTASKKIRQPLDYDVVSGSGFSHNRCISKGWAGVHVRMDWLPAESTIPSSLGLTNPAELAWELLPYSFVVDWMVPVGDWLKGFDHAMAIAHGRACISRFTEQFWTVDGLSDDLIEGAYFCTYSNNYHATRERKALIRRVTSLEPPPYPHLNKKPLKGLPKMITALALLRVAFKR